MLPRTPRQRFEVDHYYLQWLQNYSVVPEGSALQLNELQAKKELSQYRLMLLWDSLLVTWSTTDHTGGQVFHWATN
jgi:hypothetical protein